VNIRKILVNSTSLTLLACCGCTGAIERLRSDVSRLEGSLSDLRTFQAEQTTKISALESQVRAISGRIDELEYSQKQKLGTVVDSLQTEVTTLKKRVPPPPIVPVAPLEEDEALLSRLPTELAEPIGQGLQALREGNFQKALTFWEDAVYLGSGTEWAALAMFWQGISLEGLGEPRKAMETYIALVGRFPKDHRAAMVLLREASLLVRMGDKKTAKLTLNKLLADYPRSAEAVQAKERLREF
jgi:TolA-binding protein